MRICRVHGRNLTVGEGRTRLMGVVNVTPDSFSDGGSYLDPELAVEHGLALAEQGADILDIGGESTRPGYDPVPPADQIARIIPVIEGLRRRSSIPISIDTTRAPVAAAALEAGADWINDTSALQEDPELVDVVAEFRCPLVLMHRFAPRREAGAGPTGSTLVEQVAQALASRVSMAVAHGIDPRHILVDPGLGFGTTFEDNLAIVANIAPLRRLARPLVVGPSRKSFVGHITGKPASDRVHGTAAAVAILAMQGAEVIRVHDVAAMVDVVKVTDGLRESRIR